MDLDDRAARAASSLRRQVEPTVDLAAARTAVHAATGHRRTQLRRARAGAAAFAVLAVLAVVAAAGSGGSDGQETAEGVPDRNGEVRIDGDGRLEQANAAAILDALPAGELDGKTSWRLPVVASPQHDLEDGDTITLYGRGFEPNEQLGIVHCSAEADIANAGIGACQLSGDDGATFGAVQYATTDDEGKVVATVQVRRTITTPDGGTVDCASAAERCLLGMGAISNYDRSGGTYIDFAAAPDFAEPTLAIDPSGPATPGVTVTARLRGWVAHRSVRLSQCVEDRCQALADAKADATGAVDQAVVLQPSIIDDESGDEVPCEDRCVLQANGIGPTPKGDAMASHAPLPDPVALTFTSTEVSVPPTSTTTSTAPVTLDGTTPATAPTPTTAAEEPSVTTAPGPTTTTAPAGTTTSTAAPDPVPGG